MEAGLSSDEFGVLAELDTLTGDHGVEVGEGCEVLVRERLVDMDPEGLGRLQLGGVGRQVDEADAIGDCEARRGVPAGAGLAGEEGEGVGEELLVDAGADVPEALAGRGRDEGGDVEPLEAVMPAGDRALALRRPDPPDDGLQPDAVLVGGEDLDRRAGMALGLLGDRLTELSLNAACSSGVATSACCGRGRCSVHSIARSASQPRCSEALRPSSAAMKAATFFDVHTPPSSGRAFSRARSLPSTSSVSTVALAPLPRRRSPRLLGPKAL
jgi:hypothetical protein